MTNKAISKRAQALIDKRIEQAYNATCSGIQIEVMDVQKVYAEGRRAIADGADDLTLRQAIRSFVETIRR